MTHFGYPVVFSQAAIDAAIISASDTNITGPMWSKILTGGDGVLAGNVTLTTTGDVATLSPVTVRFKGFIVGETANTNYTLPPVSATTAYTIGVMFDPANYSVPGGPLSFVSATKAGIVIPSGGAYLSLMEVTRLASTPMSSTTLRASTYPCAGDVTWFSTSPATPAALIPSPRLGQVAIFGTGAIWAWTIKAGTTTPGWQLLVPASDDTGWRSDGVSMYAGWTNAGTVWRIRYGRIEVNARATRTGAAINPDVNTGGVADTAGLIMRVPNPPPYLQTPGGSYTQGGAGGGTYGFASRISTSGDITCTSAAPGATISTGTVMYLGATYTLNSV